MTAQLKWEQAGKETSTTNITNTRTSSTTSTISITSMQELLDLLINIPQEEIDQQMEQNKERLQQWLQEAYPKQLEILAHCKEKVTPQQLREQLVRDLRKITSKKATSKA
jgi:fructose-1,6-bisphosphatase